MENRKVGRGIGIKRIAYFEKQPCLVDLPSGFSLPLENFSPPMFPFKINNFNAINSLHIQKALQQKYFLWSVPVARLIIPLQFNMKTLANFYFI